MCAGKQDTPAFIANAQPGIGDLDFNLPLLPAKRTKQAGSQRPRLGESAVTDRRYSPEMANAGAGKMGNGIRVLRDPGILSQTSTEYSIKRNAQLKEKC